jgi:hypothetical protein
MTDWINNHDEKLSFTVAYVGASVILSLFVSIFWLIPIVLVHGFLEWKKAKALNVNRMRYVLLHLKLDIALIIFSLWLSVYIEASFGLLGIGSASRVASRGATVSRIAAGSRVAAKGGARILAWQNAIRGVLITLDDVAQLIRGVSRVKNRENGNSSSPLSSEKLTLLDYTIIGVSLLFILSLLFAPYLVGMEYSQVLEILKSELTPWPYHF